MHPPPALGPSRALVPLAGRPHDTHVRIHRPAAQSEKDKKKLEKGSQKARADFEAKVQDTIQEFDGTLARDIATYQQQSNKVVRLIGDYTKKMKVGSICQASGLVANELPHCQRPWRSSTLLASRASLCTR